MLLCRFYVLTLAVLSHCLATCSLVSTGKLSTLADFLGGVTLIVITGSETNGKMVIPVEIIRKKFTLPQLAVN